MKKILFIIALLMVSSLSLARQQIVCFAGHPTTNMAGNAIISCGNETLVVGPDDDLIVDLICPMPYKHFQGMNHYESASILMCSDPTGTVDTSDGWDHGILYCQNLNTIWGKPHTVTVNWSCGTQVQEQSGGGDG